MARALLGAGAAGANPALFGSLSPYPPNGVGLTAALPQAASGGGTALANPPAMGGGMGGTFTGAVPTPTPYGDFAGLDPATFARSPDSLYLQGEQQKAIQRGAAARGTLLTGGLQKRLQENAAGLASQDFQNAFNRALDVYGTNRATNAQNFGQQMSAYGGGLEGFRANQDAAQGWARLGQGQQDIDYRAAQDARARQDRETALTGSLNLGAQTAAQQQANDAYAQQVAATREQNAALSAAYARPAARPRTTFVARDKLGAR